MTSGQGWTIWQGTFLTYGEEYNPQISSNHYKFTGKERDSESGLDYFGARYYGNALGRFITPDWSSTPVPIPYADLIDPQSLNQYTYVRNLPTTRVDPDGHDSATWAAPVGWAMGASRTTAFLGQHGAKLLTAGGAILARVATTTVATVVVTASYLISPGTGGMTNDKDTIHSNPTPRTQAP